jgi:hypothetical protein
MANTISSRTYRDKYRSDTIATLLRGAMVTEAITTVDRSNNKRIQSPYGSTPTVTVQALAGTYSAADFTTTDENLDVTDEFIVAEHIMDFQELLSNFNLFASRTEQMAFNVAKKIDEFVLNNLCEDGTGTYTTPVGGFTTAANINTIFANIVSQLSGYSEGYFGNMYVVLENTDLTGLIVAGATNGFNTSDAVLKNGRVTNWMGVDVYVVRTGTFTDATVGTKTWTNSGHRVAGVKKISTVALPGGVKTDEKMVSGKTGMEVVTYGYVGYKHWTPTLAQTIDITLA